MENPYDGTQLCAQTDPEVFFPRNNFLLKQEISLAQSICKECNLINACQEYAEKQVGLYGVWAGKLYDGTGYVSPISVLNKNTILERKVA